MTQSIIRHLTFACFWFRLATGDFDFDFFHIHSESGAKEFSFVLSEIEISGSRFSNAVLLEGLLGYLRD